MNDRMPDDFAELEAQMAASDAVSDGGLELVSELVASLGADQREALLDRYRPREPAAQLQADDLPFRVRKPEVELLLAAVYRLLSEAEATQGATPSLIRLRSVSIAA